MFSRRGVVMKRQHRQRPAPPDLATTSQFMPLLRREGALLLVVNRRLRLIRKRGVIWRQPSPLHRSETPQQHRRDDRVGREVSSAAAKRRSVGKWQSIGRRRAGTVVESKVEAGVM